MAGGLSDLKSLVVRASIGALFGAVAYGAYGLLVVDIIRGRSVFLPPDFPLWIVAIALTVVPVTLLSATVARLVINRFAWSPQIAAFGLAPIMVAGSIFLFEWYMHELAPTVDWWRGWWLPGLSVLVTVTIEALRIQSKPATALT